MDLLPVAIVILVGYFLGAISFAVIIAKHHGVDIFKQGSGNPGATNVKRAIGKKAGNLVFALDCLKGFIAALWPLFAFASDRVILLGVLGLMAAILGHSFSIFLKFRGGKGVATAVGGLLALAPWVMLIGAGCWLICFYTTRYVSLASIVLGVSLPFSGFLLGQPLELNVFFLVLAALIVIRHRSNIKRLLEGTENRFVKEQPATKS